MVWYSIKIIIIKSKSVVAINKLKDDCISNQEHFWSLDKTEFRIPPKLIVQVWDNDKFSLDDYLGKKFNLKSKQD